MKHLHPQWFLEGIWDLEYKQYLLLAYLQEVRAYFRQNRLYPPLAELIASWHELHHLKKETQLLLDSLPKEITGVGEKDFEYQTLIQQPEALIVLEELVDFALPLIEAHIEEGTRLYETIEKTLQAEIIGILPTYREEGYVFLSRGNEPFVYVYSYKLLRVLQPDKSWAIRMEPLGAYPVSPYTNYLKVKEEILKSRKDTPLPLVLKVETELILPIKETLIPIIQRNLPLWTQVGLS
ncbi:MAG: hypothetical protein ACUVRD_03305 [Bacteroidia bacterium]